MGILTTMRNRGGLLATIIGFAIVAFLVGDVLITGQNIFGGNDTTVGEIAGKKIDYRDFDKQLQQNIENFRASQGNVPVDDNLQGYLSDQTWNQIVAEKAVKGEIEKAGVVVSSEELYDLIQGTYVDDEVKRNFTNEAGIFEPSRVVQFIQTMDQRDPSGKLRSQWVNFEKQIKEKRLNAKYFNLIQKGLYVPNLVAEADYMDRSKTADFKYIVLDYFSVNDSSITISDDELKEYYKKNSFKYQSKETTRSFEYLFTEVVPSSEDSARVVTWINEKAEHLRADDDDSLYIALNADTKLEARFSKKGMLGPILDTNLFNAPEGSVYGPYMEAGAYKVATVLKAKSIPDSVKARHILIQIENNNLPAAQKLADSLKKMIQEGADFAALARTNSKDQGSAVKGGDLGYFAQGMMVQPFNDACFYGKPGDVVTVVSQFGVHVIQIQDQKNFNRNVMVGILDRKIEAGNSTVQAAFTEINNIRASIETAEAFDNFKPTATVSKRVAEDVRLSERNIAGLESPRELVRWAYTADIGDISQVYELGTKFVFAKLTAIKEKGTLDFEYVKKQVEAEVRKEKKKKQLTEKLATAANGASSIEAVAQKLGLKVDTAINTTFAIPMIPGISREPEVIGTVFAIGKGKVSKPIGGQRGAYLVEVFNIVEPINKADLSMSKFQIANQLSQRSQAVGMEALKEKANIQDYRGKFY